MSLRKSPRADLRRAVPLLFETGVIAALLLLIAAFRTDLPSGNRVSIARPAGQDVIEMPDIPLTDQRPDPPRPRLQPPVEAVDDPDLQEVEVDLGDAFGADNLLPTTPPALPAPPLSPPPSDPPDVHDFVPVEDMPQMLPDEEAAMRALQRSITYPEAARRAQVEGRVIVQFVVDRSGAVREVTVLRGIGAGCDEEAIRAVQGLRFTPGRQRGKPVEVRMTLPITFRLR